MEIILVLFGLVLLVIPFVMPLISWLTARSARNRVIALEAQVRQQAQAIEGLEAEIVRLRREGAASVPRADVPEAEGADVRVGEAPAAEPIVETPPLVPTFSTPAPELGAAAFQEAESAESEPEPGVAPPPPSPPPPPVVPVAPRPRWSFDVERVAVKLSAGVAGVALVIAAVSFLRYSIAYGWLQPPVRVLIGIATAVGLLIGCELKAARRYPTTANALDAAAIAILFATFFAAHALWDLIPGGVAFLALAVVTALAVLLSIRRESLFIAVLGLLGGFATPVLLSTGEDRPIPLFAYLLLLNVGLAWVAYRNTWPILTVLTVIFTTLYQWGWVLQYLGDASELPLAMAIFLVFPVVTFAGLMLARPGRGDAAAAATFERTAVGASIVPVVFTVLLAAVPEYGERAGLLFGFLFLIVSGLLAIGIVRAQPVLYATAAGSTLLAFAVWLALSYVEGARFTTLGFTAAFVLLFLGADVLARRVAMRVPPEGRLSRYAAPLLLFLFPALAYLEPSFATPWPLFGTLALALAACAWRAMATRDGHLYFVAAFFSVAAQAVWSVMHLTIDTLGTGVLVYVGFGAISIAVPTLARARGRELQPAAGGGIVLLASLGLLLYLSTGPVSGAALWALALLLAILNAGVFVESAGARMPLVSIAGSLLSWLVLASWWERAAGEVGTVPSLAVLVGLTLLTLGGHAWASGRAPRPETTAARPLRQLVSSGLFLGLVGHLFLVLLASNREWSLPPWPVFGALTVMTLAASAAALYARVPVLHSAAAAAAALVVAVWAVEVSGSPWPAVALLGGAAVSAYALGWMSWWRRAGEGTVPAAGAAAALFIGEVTAIAALESEGRPFIGAFIVAHLTNLGILLWLCWTSVWPRVTVGVALVAWAAVFDWWGPWGDHLALASALYLLLLAYPLIVGVKARARRDPHIAAVIGSAMFFFAGREALLAGGLAGIVGIIPVIAAAGLAIVLRQLLAMEADGTRDSGRLALVAGAALGFVTVAIPVQLQHQWITIGWALEGAALAWLFTRVPHRGLLYASSALLAVVFARLAMNPEVFHYEPRGALRILNWYLYTYLLAAGAMLAAAWWFRRTDDRLFDARIRPSRLLPGAAVILLFLLLNIEIADFYATGPDIVFRFGAGVSQDLTYTIAWLVFGMLLLAAGIYSQSRPARIAAVALIAITAFKCFLYDLGSLGGLYRVGSFVGLAISLAIVSIVLQKYVLARPREAQ